MFKTHRTFELTTGVKNNTIAVVSRPDYDAVVYHQTVVFERRKRKITLRDGGWNTLSTTIVINRALDASGLDYRMTRKKFERSIVTPSGAVLPFVSGMELKT